MIKATLLREFLLDHLVCEFLPCCGEVISVEDCGEAIVKETYPYDAPVKIDIVWADESEPTTYKLSVERKRFEP